MRLKLTGDGTPSGTKVVDADTNSELHGVTKIKFVMLQANGKMRVKIELVDVDFNLVTPPQSSLSSSPVPNSSSGSYQYPAGSGGGYSPSPSPTYTGGSITGGPGNPGYQSPNPYADPSVSSPNWNGNPDGGDMPMSPPDSGMDHCQHTYVNVGFHTIRLVCKHCNNPKPD